MKLVKLEMRNIFFGENVSMHELRRVWYVHESSSLFAGSRGFWCASWTSSRLGHSQHGLNGTGRLTYQAYDPPSNHVSTNPSTVCTMSIPPIWLSRDWKTVAGGGRGGGEQVSDEAPS